MHAFSRAYWISAVMMVLGTTAASAQVAFTPGSRPPTFPRFPAGPDYATDVLGDPWDFANADDLSPDPDELFGWTQEPTARLVGTANAFLSAGSFRGTINHGDNQLSLLHRGWYDVITPGRTGVRFPIQTAKYRKVAIRTSYSGTVTDGAATVLWFFYPNGHPQGTTVGIADLGRPLAGTQTQVVDLVGSHFWGAQWTSQSAVRGFRLDPSSSADPITVTIDWVRLTAPDGASAANMFVDVACGGSWSVVAIDSGGETAMRAGTAGQAGSGIAVNYGVLPPGSYALGLRCNGTLLGPTTPFTVNAPASVRITSPGAMTGKDFATETLPSTGAWDLDQNADIARLANVLEPSFEASPAGREFRGRNFGDGSPQRGDPQVYLMAEANNSTPIASSRYRYLTYTLTVEGSYEMAPPNGGSVARVLWASDTFSTLSTHTNSQDIRVWPGRNSYTIDLARLSATPDPIEGTGIETECVPNCPITSWASRSVRFLRIDPHEFPIARFFRLGKVHLTAAPEVVVGESFTISYRNADDAFAAGDSHRVRFFADTDTNAATPGALIGTVSNLAPLPSAEPDRTFVWNTTGVAPGMYHIYAEITDVATGETSGAYSDVPVRVFVPGSSTIQINVMRPTLDGTEYAPFTISGCAANPGASGNSGVDDIQISATGGNDVDIPSQRGATITLGEDPTYNPARGTKYVGIPCPSSAPAASDGTAAAAAYAQSGFAVTNITGLSPGHWTLRIVARDAVDGQLVEQTVPFAVEARSAPARNLRLSSVSGNAITIAWDPPNEGRAILAYRIEVSSSPTFASLSAAITVPLSVTSGSSTLGNGVWYIRIITVSDYSPYGAPSNVLNFVLPGGGAPTPPGAPTLTGTQVTANPISLGWAPGAGGTPAAYTLHAGTATGMSNLGVFPMGTATSISAAAPVGSRIFVRVVASNSVGNATSNEIDFVVAAPTAPGTPTMNAAVVSGRSVTLSWTAPTAGGTPTGYTVHARFTATGPIFATLSASSTTVTVPYVPPGTYYVSVVANSGAGSSAESNQVTLVVP